MVRRSKVPRAIGVGCGSRWASRSRESRMFFCFILLYETQLRAFCQHIFTYFLFAGTQKLGEGKIVPLLYSDLILRISIKISSFFVSTDCAAGPSAGKEV